MNIARRQWGTIIILILVCTVLVIGKGQEELSDYITAFGAVFIVFLLHIAGTRKNNLNKSSPEEAYRPSNPILTFLGINAKQIIWWFLGFAAMIFVFINVWVSYAIIILAIILYLVYRKNIIADYENIKINGVPLNPAYSYNFSKGASSALLFTAVVFFVGVVVYAYLK